MERNINNDSSNYKLSIIIPAKDETDTFKKVLTQIINGFKTDYEIIVYLKDGKCPAAKTLKEIIIAHPDVKITSLFQKVKYIHEDELEVASKYSSGTHFTIWTADDEISVNDLLKIVDLSEKKKDAIVCAAKFYKNKSIKGYGFIRMVVRKTLNFSVKILYHKQGKDFFSLYQIVPRSYLNEMNFFSAKNFIYESTLIPLRLDKEYIEIPADFHKREEGHVNFSIWLYIKMTFEYLYNIFKIRLTPKAKLIKKNR